MRSSAIAHAVATFSESTPAAMGMRTVTSAVVRVAARSPAPSAPSSRARAGGHGQRGDVDAVVRVQRDQREARGAHPRQRRVPVRHARPREQQRSAHGDADRLAVQRIAGRRRQQGAGGAERARRSQHAAHVVGIADVLEQDEPSRHAGEHVVDGRLRAADAQRHAAAVEVESHDGLQHRRRRQVHRDVGALRQCVGERRTGRVGQQDRVDAESAAGEELPHHVPRLGDEEPVAAGPVSRRRRSRYGASRGSSGVSTLSTAIGSDASA